MFLTPEQKGISKEEINEICEMLWNKEVKIRKCPDCGADPDSKHKDSCDIARCTECGGQRLSCDCIEGDSDIWEGIWPGVQECYQQKLICWDTCKHPITGKELGWSFDLNTWNEMNIK